MKFGNVIMDARSNEAKELIGKRVVACNNFNLIETRPEELETCVLRELDYKRDSPFNVDYVDNWEWYERYTFIREVIV